MKFEELFIDGHKLPDPLSKQELLDLLSKVKHGDEMAREKIVLHNLRLVFYEVTKHFTSVKYEKKDLVSIGIIGLLKAIDNFEISKNFEFSTYATKCIYNEILMYLRKLKKYENDISLDTNSFYDKNGDEIKPVNILLDSTDIIIDYENKEIYSIIREIVENLPDKDREIISLYFGFFNNKRLNQREIADLYSVSKAYISRIITKNLKKIRKDLEKRDIIEKKYKVIL